MKLSHKTWILISGVVWGAIGCLLLYKGLGFLSEGVESSSDRALWFISAGLFVGFLKGRFVFRKTVNRITGRLMALSNPIGLTDAYPKGYWILLASMMSLGFLLRLVPLEVRGFIDVAVGSALIHGSMFYFRAARELPLSQNDEM